MQDYETQPLTKDAAISFMVMFDKKIGTDRELTDLGNGMCYVYCVELLWVEIPLCREIEYLARDEGQCHRVYI